MDVNYKDGILVVSSHTGLTTKRASPEPSLVQKFPYKVWGLSPDVYEGIRSDHKPTRRFEVGLHAGAPCDGLVEIGGDTLCEWTGTWKPVFRKVKDDNDKAQLRSEAE